MVSLRLLIVISILLFSIFVTTPVLAEEPGTGSVADSLEKNQTEAELPTNEEVENAPLQDTNENLVGDEVTFDSGTSLFVLFIQMILALVFIIGLIYVLLRFVGKKTRSFQSLKTIENIGGVPLGTNRSIQLVKVGERILVVGVGETIQLLKEIDKEEEIAALLAQQETEFERFEEPISKATAWLSNTLQRKQPSSKQGTQGKKDELQFSDLLTKQLKDVSKSQRKIREAMKEHNNE